MGTNLLEKVYKNFKLHDYKNATPLPPFAKVVTF